MKHKKMTFLVQDMELNQLNVVQWQSTRRTVEEAWNDCRKHICVRKGLEEAWNDCRKHICVRKGLGEHMEEFIGRFVKVMTYEGLVQRMDETIPLRRATPEEMKEL